MQPHNLSAEGFDELEVTSLKRHLRANVNPSPTADTLYLTPEGSTSRTNVYILMV